MAKVELRIAFLKMDSETIETEDGGIPFSGFRRLSVSEMGCYQITTRFSAGRNIAPSVMPKAS